MGMMLRRMIVVGGVLGLAAVGQGAVIYDGASGVTADAPAWGWFGYSNATAFPHTPNRTYTSGGTQLTSGATEKSGFSTSPSYPFPYTNSAVPVLAPATTWDVRIDAQLLSETHDNTTHGYNRAGFDIIALRQDNQGVELAFWQDRVFALGFDATPGAAEPFYHAEETLVDTTQLRDYVLRLKSDNTYELYVDGSATPSLTGNLRTYSAPGSLPLPVFGSDVYQVPSFLFFGDDTTAASGTSTVTYVAVNAVPEPGTLGVLGVGMLGLLRRRAVRSRG